MRLGGFQLLRALPVAAVSLLLAAASVAAPQPETSRGFPRDLSVDGYRIDSLIEVTMWMVLALFVIMCGVIAVAVVKHGRKHEAHYDHGHAGKQVIFALAVSSVIFFVVDGNLFYNSVKDLGEAFWNWDKPENDPDTVRVEINARQWAWDIRLAGPDGEFATPDDIVTLNDLRIPVGAPVYIQLAASDVIHSFYLPNFRQKIDAVPGSVNRLWFEAKETGEVDIACAQHCGVNHYLMKGQLTILEPAAFEAWQQQASRISMAEHDPNDPSTHWGWPWKTMKD